MRGAVISFLDFFLPRFCPACKTRLQPDEKLVCADCLSTLELVPQEMLLTEYNRKFRSGGIISDFYSHFLFSSDSQLQSIIHSLKYEKHFRLGVLLGELMCFGLEQKISEWNIDVMVPAPLHYLKQSERGYNQSYYIAAGISKKTGIAVTQRAIYRSTNTKSQTTMTIAERKANVNRAFSIRNKKLITGKKVLLIDDVITTGSTLEAAGRILKQAGASEIYAATAALADLDSAV